MPTSRQARAGQYREQGSIESRAVQRAGQSREQGSIMMMIIIIIIIYIERPV
jgi:hypothetical protein